MQKHISRRALTRALEEQTRRATQGRDAMRLLAALVVHLGGSARVPRDTFAGLPPTQSITVERERLTGDLLVHTQVPKPQMEEITFAELREKYGAKNTEREVNGPADDLADAESREPRAASPQPSNPPVGLPQR